jgi:type IV secretory pathway VirB2 component (pilin)
MATKTGRTGFPLAAAGVGIIGVAIVFGLTTSTGDLDWIGIITAVAGFVMVFTGLYQAFRGGGRHPA